MDEKTRLETTAIPSLRIGDEEVSRGQRHDAELSVGRLPSGDVITMPVVAICGAQPGPGVYLTAALHGDEVGGTEIVRQVVSRLDPAALRGHVVAAPVVNIRGFAEGTRYLPDRRDLNRAFPGSRRGSLAARLAALVLEQVVSACDVGIDLHTGSDHRSNLPQIRADLSDPLTLELATAFGAPAMLDAQTRDGSLRAASVRAGKTSLLFEGGEALRLDEAVIAVAVEGILRVLTHLGMIDGMLSAVETPFIAHRSSWVRAPMSGLLITRAGLGERVVKGEVLGTIGNVLATEERIVRSRITGMVVGRTENPVVHSGDGLFHVAAVEALGNGD